MPANTITVREVLRQASTLLADIAPQYDRQPEHEMVGWLNEGQLWISGLLPLSTSRIDAIKLKAGSLQSIESILQTDIKPSDGTTPTATVLGTQLLRVMCNMGSDGLTEGRAIRLTVQEAKDMQNSMWRTNTGSEVKEYCHEPVTPRQFEVWPAVTGNVWVRVSMNAQPAIIPNSTFGGSALYPASGAASLKISLADEYAQMLVNLIVARSMMRETEWADAAKAQFFSGLVVNGLNAKVAAVTGANPNLKSLPFSPNPVGQAG